MKEEFKLFIKNNLFTILLFIPVFVTIIGLIIINIYLSQYGIVEYDYFKIQSLYTGAFFLVFCFLLVVYFCLFIDIVDLASNDIGRVFWITFVKICIITLVFSLLFFDFKEKYLLYGDIYIEINLIKGLMIILLFGFASLFISYDEYKENRMNYFWKKVYKLSLLICNIISVVLHIFLFISDKNYANLTHFFSVFGIFLFLRIIIKKEYTELRNAPNYIPISYFSKDITKSISYEMVFALSTFLIILIMLLSLYSISIYPQLPKNIGGGKPQKVTLIVDNKKVTGKIVHSNGRQLFIEINNSELAVIAVNQIDVIKIVQ